MVVILDEKQMPLAPPPYKRSESEPGLPPFPGHELSSISRPPASFEALPPHIVLHIVYQTLNPRKGRADVEYKRKVLYWMTVCLRLVNRPFYIACMHVLRSTYLPAYLSMIKPPYTSDPFPLSSPGSGSAMGLASSSSTMTSPVDLIQRETQVLDMFLTAKVREDVWADDTELHLEREEAFQDLFSVLQPRARLEDLVRIYGTEAGVITTSTGSGNTIVASGPAPSSSSSASATTSPTPSPSTSSFPHPYPRSRGTTTRRIPFNTLSCSFGTRSAGVVLTMKSTRRTIVEVPREREEKLEVAAKRLVKGLQSWVLENNSG